MFKSNIIKGPNIKEEACVLNVPDLEFAYRELLTAQAETAAVEEAPADQAVEAATGETEEEPPIPPEVIAEQLLEEARQQAEAIIATAREQADSILAELEEERKQTAEELAQAKAETAAECDRLKKEAHDRGYEEGWAAGQAEGEKAWAEKIAAAETTLQEAKAEALNLINQAEEERIARIYDSEEEILKLAVGIAEKIINSEIKKNQEKWLGMIRVATEKVAGATEVTIRIAQEDEAFLIQNLREIRGLFTESPRLQVETDPNLKPGDFILQTNMGEVDARLQQQIAKIYQALKEEGS
ncbi:MAG: hypothetical protein GX202_03700 [Firmicutes bacterium]|nr:hypothetical protein [Bacillota bacterium]